MFFNDDGWGKGIDSNLHGVNPNRALNGVKPSFSDYLPHMLRAGEVRRWHTIHVTREQTLAEHNFNVLAISLAIVDEFNESTMAQPDIDPSNLARLVAFHDLHEIWTGDFPSPIKRIDPGLVEAIKTKAEEKFVGKTDLFMIDPRLYFVMKMADMLDALWFVTQYGHGEYAARVEQEIIIKVGGMLEEIAVHNPPLASAMQVIRFDRMGKGATHVTHLED